MATEANLSGLRLGPIVARLARHIEVALAEFDLSASQYRTLAFLAGGAVNASILAERLALRRPSVTSVVDALVARGYVEREDDPQDRRRIDLRLTPSGEVALDAADAAVGRRLDELLDLVDLDDAEAARGGLQAWVKPLDSFRAAKRAGR